jgi:hypothetical protein
MDRWKIDLGEARDEEPYMIHGLEYLYVGSCDGDVTIKLDSRSASPLNPSEFSKLLNVKSANWLYVTNTAQSGKELVLYVKEARRLWL